jgi:hypothetical protein
MKIIRPLSQAALFAALYEASKFGTTWAMTSGKTYYRAWKWDHTCDDCRNEEQQKPVKDMT